MYTAMVGELVEYFQILYFFRSVFILGHSLCTLNVNCMQLIVEDKSRLFNLT